ARGGEPARPKVWGAKLRGKLGDDRAAALRLQRGLVLIEEGRLGEAEQIFRNLPDDARGFPYRSFAYAVLEAHRDHPEESLDHFRAVLDGRNRPLPGLLQNHYPLAYVVARALRRDEQNLNARGEELPAPLRRFLSPSGAAK
ncbi:MAG TPA: hypothetical protein VIL46_05955, partial [Gemmataceae bacterium]